MGGYTRISGHYEVINQSFLREKAARLHDPRHVFYLAMLSNRTYEGYLAEVGDKLVDIKGYREGPISGRMEILYSRRRGWIADSLGKL